MLALVAQTVRQLTERTRDVIRLLGSAAWQDESAAKALTETNARIRHNLQQVAGHLRETQTLKASIDIEKATDVLEFYFRSDSYLYLVDTLHWQPENASGWLADCAGAALLTNRDSSSA